MAMSCNHHGWFYLSGKDTQSLHYGARTENVIKQMVNPHQQYPSTILLLGRKFKDVALRQVFPYNNVRRGDLSGLLNLRLDSATISSDFPILIADGDPWMKLPEGRPTAQCHDLLSNSVKWAKTKSETVLTVYARLAALFCDVICIFADDIGGLQEATSLALQWIRLGNPACTPTRIRPRLLIVTTEENASSTYNILELDELQYKLSREDEGSRKAVFSSVKVMHMSSERLSPLARHRRLREVLLTELDITRKARIEHRLLFNAVHYSALFQAAFVHLTQSHQEPFDAIRSTRIGNEIGADFQKHIHTFLTASRECRASYEALTSFVASSIVMDAYPPRAHKFEPIAMYTTLYRQHCLNALEAFFSSRGIATHLDEMICERIEDLFPMIDLGYESSLQLHRGNLQQLTRLWPSFQSQRTCLACLRRKPEQVLSCGHAICDVCVVLFGTKANSHQVYSYMARCILCVDGGKALVRLKPPTAGARVLSIDGGGTRGVVPLEFLSRLQQILGTKLRLQDMFELAFGTSSGALIVMGLFMKNWTIAKSIEMFDNMARDFFGKQLIKGNGVFLQVRRIFRCWLNDGIYDVDMLEAFLKDKFGDTQRIFDVWESEPSGTKVAVTASTISDASPYLFSNYNGCGQRTRDCGYKHARAQRLEKEPYLWQVGRATSAAPSFFRPVQIESFGSFQDGGLKYNNPMELAEMECQKIWSKPVVPDMVLSLGTGKLAIESSHVESPQAPSFRHIFNDGFLIRLMRAFNSSIDSEKMYEKSLYRLDDETRARYYRLNIQFPGPEPRLDDVEQIETLRKSVHLQARSSIDLNAVIIAVLTACFYFELESCPEYDAGGYWCRGFIRCRNDPHAVLEALYSLLPYVPTLAFRNEYLGELSAVEICASCQSYGKQVSFRVLQLEDKINFHLKDERGQRHSISGFPQCMAWFQSQQLLDRSFGTVDHDITRAHRCTECSIYREQVLPRSGRKRKEERPEPGSGTSKRRRLRLNLKLLTED